MLDSSIQLLGGEWYQFVTDSKNFEQARALFFLLEQRGSLLKCEHGHSLTNQESARVEVQQVQTSLVDVPSSRLGFLPLQLLQLQPGLLQLNHACKPLAIKSFSRGPHRQVKLQEN